MKLADAERIIYDYENKDKGYLVHFERRENGMLCSDMVPNSNEPPFTTEHDAWQFAVRLAAATVGRFVNIYVIYAGDFRPVEGYEKLIRNRY